jgi:uncharacterized lipoprotein YajG
MKHSLILVLAATFLLAGCAASVSSETWQKPGIDRDQRRRDEYECTRGATLRGETREDRRQLLVDCMRQRGYERAK